MRQSLRSLVLALAAMLFSTAAWAQSITGTITDDAGEPLPGASVIIKEKEGMGAITDPFGVFTFTDISSGTYTLQVSFIGFQTQTRTVEVGNSTEELEIVLPTQDNQLDEIVVVGYGVQRRRDMTGSVVKLNAKEINDMPAPSFETTLQGKAPGVQIVTGGGMAGSSSVVRIRGASSVGGGADPLYIIDGVQLNQDYFGGRGQGRASGGGMNQNPLAFINPDDIQSVEVLKDAAATAIYGSRAANGVIIITTKRGSTKDLRFNFTTTQGTSQPTALPDMLGADQWLQIHKEAWVNDGNTGVPNNLPGGLSWEEAQQNNTDWVDLTTRTGHKQFYDFSVEQAKEKYNFYAGLSYDANQSYLRGDQYNRLSGRINGDVEITEDLNLSLSSNLTHAIYERVDNAWSGGFGAAMSTALPIYPVYYDEDVYDVDAQSGDSTLVNEAGDYWLGAGAVNNPVAMRELKQWQNRELRSVNNLRLNYNLTDDFTLSASASVDYGRNREDIYEPAGPGTYLVNQPDLGAGIAKRYPRTALAQNYFLTGTYRFDLGELHKLNLLVGGEFVNKKTRISQIRTVGDNNTVGVTNEIQDAEAPFYESSELDTVAFDSISIENQRKFISMFSRAEYKFKDRYLAQLVFRGDGSSSFGPNNRFGFFPSLGLGWIVSDEDWLRSNRTISYLKLKTSVGLVGNANIPQNQFTTNYEINNLGYNQQPIRYPINRENRDLKWETTTIFDAGLEMGLFSDRITAEVAYYHKRTEDVLMNVGLPRYNGFTSFWDNVGGVVNYGVEFSFTSHNVVRNDFSWKTDFNVAFNRNRITSLGGYSPDAVGGGTNDTRVVVGESIGTFYMVPLAYIDEDNGQPVYYNLDGETTTVYNQDNRVAVGKGIPDAIGGLTNTFRYKNWSLSALMVFSVGADIYDHSGKYQQTAWPAFGNYWNYTERIYDRWVKPGDEARLPALTQDRSRIEGLEEDYWNTNLWVEDASYMRLRNLTLGYRFQRKVAEKVGLDGLEVALIGTNLLTFTEYRGLDPEVSRDFDNVTDRAMSVNTTYLTPPQEKTYSIRLTAKF